MATFPILKTGAVAQYPAERTTGFKTQVLEFIDGQEQRFRDYGSPMRGWVVHLDLLDAGELQEVANFFEQVGPASPFAFTDPWNGSVHAACSLQSGDCRLELLDEWRGRTELIIRENRT